jgi:hypothetical protein
MTTKVDTIKRTRRTMTAIPPGDFQKFLVVGGTTTVAGAVASDSGFFVRNGALVDAGIVVGTANDAARSIFIKKTKNDRESGQSDAIKKIK